MIWTFSIYLEAVAILPQLVLLQRTQNIDNLTGNYVFLLGCVGALLNGSGKEVGGWGNVCLAGTAVLLMRTAGRANAS